MSNYGCMKGFRIFFYNIIYFYFPLLDFWQRTKKVLRPKCCSVLSLFWHGRTSIASIPLWEPSSLPKHSDDWRAYNGSLICVPWRMQHARTPSCSKHWYSVITQHMNTSITPSNLSSRIKTTVKHTFLQNRDIILNKGT